MRKRPPVQAITSAGRGLSEDIHGRAVRYTISMSVRTGCVVAAAFTEGWLRWALIVGAVVLPAIAVIAANAGRERPEQATTFIAAPAIEAGPGRTQHRSSMPPVDLRGGYLR